MADANQSDLTITGVGGDPSGTHPTGSLMPAWTKTSGDGIVQFSSAAGAWFTDTSTDGLQYGPEIALTGKAVSSMYLDIVNTGDSGCTAAWEWFNPHGTSYDGTGDMLGGTWTTMGSLAQNYAAQEVLDHTNLDWAAIQQSSKWRVKISCSGSADVSATLNAADSMLVYVGDDRTDELNLSLTGTDIGGDGTTGIGADPS